MDLLSGLLSGASGGTLSPSFGGAQTSFRELLNRINGKGLAVEYAFSRRQSLHGAQMISVSLKLSNTTNAPLTNVHIPATVTMHMMS